MAEAHSLPPVLIPAYRPGAALEELIAELEQRGFARIVVVDDGSGAQWAPLFKRIQSRFPGVSLLRHGANLGKGAALKTGMRAILEDGSGLAGIVTADADGQHLPADIERVARALQDSGGAQLILGARRFEGPAPWRSLWGNRISATAMRWLAGARLSDTQTGLRGIPAPLARRMLEAKTGGYEFELDMLLAAKHSGVPWREVRISTVYIDGNVSSHFDPLRDSMRIYFVLLRFALASLLTALIDNAVFAAVWASGRGLAGAQCAARAVAMAFNYTAARRAVFHSRQPHLRVLPLYLALVASHTTVSYWCILWLIRRWNVTVIEAKIAVEAALFLANFIIQRDFIFTARPAPGGATDWNSYYASVPWTARLTRRYSASVLVKLLRAAGVKPGAHWVEIGGGNSCFYERLKQEFAPASYEAIDLNRRALEMLRQRSSAAGLKLTQADVLGLGQGRAADVVFSAGLIEHFGQDGTQRAVAAHLEQCRKGGIVLVTFPTPAWLYRAARVLLEWLGLWRFPDERPLPAEEVRAALGSRAEILAEKTMWPLILTQTVIVARRK